MPTHQNAFDRLRAAALAFPGAYEDHPWGESVAKVNRRVFAFLGRREDGVGLTVKLPQTGKAALMMPFTQPTGYGLGKSGWVTAQFEPGEEVPFGLLQEWIRESYLAIAPAKLAAQVAGRVPTRKRPR